MAAPMSANSLVAMLRAEGARVVEDPGWRTRNRNHKGPWGPVNGVMIHHTVTGKNVDGVAICRNGYATLPGPLCHGVIRRDGTVVLVGNGRANHAGGGDPDVLQAVKDERYNAKPPTPKYGNSNGVDGNARFYGFECENLGDGKDPWSAAQVEAIVRVSAAICRFHKWTAKSTIGHSEWSADKSDPKGPGDVVAMPRLRGKIQERLNHAPSWNPAGTPAPKPAPKPGGTVTAPTQIVLSRPEDVTLIKNNPYTVYWTVEHTDPTGEHGDGGKTIGDNLTYTGTVTVTLPDLVAGESVEFYMAEEDSTGARIGAGDLQRVIGVTTDQPTQVALPFSGRVGQRLVFEAVSRQDGPAVTLSFARLSLLTWPNA